MDTVEGLLNKQNIDYRISGHDYIINCLNPEHIDNKPSMKIDKLTGIFHCFSCGHSGNLFYLYNAHRNETDIRVKNIQEKIRELMRSNLFIPLTHEPFYEDYRGISKETYKKFEAFKYNGELEGKDLSARIIFPIYDINKNIKFFIARYIHSKLDPKYIITPTSTKMGLYPPKIKPINGSMILVEGIFDMINLWDKGLTNVVCSFGINFGAAKKFKKVQESIEKLHPYKIQGVHTIYIMYDGDTPGKTAANRLKNNIEDKFMVDIIELPEGLDPGSFDLDDVNMLKETLNY